MPDRNLIVEIATVADSDVTDGVRRLVPLLSPSASIPSPADLQAMVNAPGTCLLLARNAGQIVGMLTLVVFQIPSGVRAWIEDVVVDPGARGLGIGERLIREAINIATARRARTVELTSRPSREAANRLYVRVGFSRRDTNVYRFSIQNRD